MAEMNRDIARAGVWHDAQGLSGLKRAAREANPEALRAAAEQFEALFVGQMLSAMRNTLPEDGPFSSEHEQSYRQMLDQQLAVEIASSGDFGIADALVRQLGGPEAASGPRVADDPLAAAGRLRVDLAAGRWAGPSADPSAEKTP
ncbi:MAG: rod-binding protein [Pseudomonadales bacterium]|jgi:flagellar protein FlgJ|nr:rod-binding protein [Pseudomonadales bacterium]